MKNLITILFLFCAYSAISQGEANFWYFGKQGGLNFNDGTATVASGSQINTNEGCASFSDTQGNLLFYTDGTKVWNKNHAVMQNGGNLLGNPSSTQSAIIVPHPGNNNLFYIFTVGATIVNSNNVVTLRSDGLNCYTVDMRLNSGLGEVVPNSKIDLSLGINEQWTEKVTSVKGADCKTFWVISLVNDTFVSYKIDETGLINLPIIAKVDFYSNDRRGYLKVSPDGKKLASATQGNLGNLMLYSFNDSNGKVANDGKILISNIQQDGQPYGVEFSPRSSILYCSTYTPSSNLNKLWQFDVENPTIASGKYLVSSKHSYRGALQLAPNGKIYATLPPDYNNGTQFLDAINLPDEFGTNCSYQENAIDLGAGRAMQGLPPFIASILLPVEITDDTTTQNINNTTVKRCLDENYRLTAINISGTSTYKWAFNGVPIDNFTSQTLILNNLTFSNSGTYQLEVDNIDECGFKITYKGEVKLEVYAPPVIANYFIYDQCDIDNDTTDGMTQFNLTTKIEEITQNDPNLEVSFFESQADLSANNPILNSGNYTSATNPNFFVKLTDKRSECFTVGKMALNVYPTSLYLYANYYECEKDISLNNTLKSAGSGKATFDFEFKRQEIETLFNDPSIEVTFFQNTNDAQLQINFLQGIIEFPSKEIIVRISNKLSKNCISMGKFDLVVNKIPIPNGSDDDIILCVNNPRDNPQLFTAYLDGKTVDNTDTYQWYFNNIPISGATNSFYEANSEGIYKVEVTHLYENNLTDLRDDSSCKGFSIFKIIESNPPAIQINDIEIQDDSTNNTINISGTNLGFGTYEFALIDYKGAVEYPYQNEPFFGNVPAGIYTLLINDKKNCGTASIDISIIGYPKFFTPNNDGHNDTWNVLGISENFYQSAIIYIFNRFGKLIKEINLYGEGWDGTFNGEFLPATDYWFSVELVDLTGNIRLKKGHFSLIRR